LTIGTLGVPAEPVNTYARGTTADSLRAIELWDTTRDRIEWDDGCFVGAQDSTHRFFFNRDDLPVVYASAPSFAILYAPALATEVRAWEGDLPCAIFEGGLLSWASEESVWNSRYDVRVRQQGFSLRLDSSRTDSGALLGREKIVRP
jgi:hypothetical protein